MRVAIYSALYGGYEEPKPLPEGLDVPAFMYTDNAELHAPGWTIIYAPLGGLGSPMMRAKYWKTRSLITPDVSIWVDASVSILDASFPERCVDALGDDDWAAVKHPARDCVYDEAIYSATLPRYAGAALAEQATYYRSIGHPAHWGLLANGVIVRRRVAAAEKLNHQWWYECVERTWQDQVSLPVLLRLAGEALRWNMNIPWHGWWSHVEHS